MGATVQHFKGGADIQRQVRAKNTGKHHDVDRFGVPKAPRTAPQVKAVKGELVSRGQSHSAKPAAAPMPSMVASASHQKLERLLDQALTHADTHKEALRYHAARHFWQRGRRWPLVAVIIVIILAALVVSWEKVPELSVKTAGIQAHISPTVPSYKPDGFRMAGPAHAVSGTVSIKYVASDDSSNTYNIVQAESNLNSSSVGQSVVPKGSSVQTSQVEGNTVYIYGQENDAAWVNNGVLYTIQDKAHLSSDELIKIVQGLNP